MTIAEMHVWFRQYAQQMGMQNVRAILPEQIDILINTSITDTVNRVIAENTNMTGAGGIVSNSKLGQINALRTLYDVKLVDVTSSAPEAGCVFTYNYTTDILRLHGDISYFNKYTYNYYKIIETHHSGTAYYHSVSVTEEEYNACANKEVITDAEYLEQYEDVTYVGYGIKLVNTTTNVFNYLYLADLSLSYFKSDFYTNPFPVRIIDDVHLADTIHDFALRPQVKDPIGVIYNNQLDLYIDKTTNGSLPQGLRPNKLRVGYIAIPAVVQYNSSNPTASVDCDLPEYMHVDILKHAVDLYRIAVNNGMYTNQQQQVQNPSTARMTGTGNEGYQS